jgi:hypothetical protein
MSMSRECLTIAVWTITPASYALVNPLTLQCDRSPMRRAKTLPYAHRISGLVCQPCI